MRAYSKRWDILDDLTRALHQLRRVVEGGQRSRRSVTSTGRRGAVPPIAERLGEERLAELVADRKAGMQLRELATHYGISLSSVKRVLRASVGEDHGGLSR